MRERTSADTDPDSSPGPDLDRGQAYTLEGFIGAMVVLMAVLFALQSVVITPTTGGLADRTVQAQLQQETQDALLVANQDGNLSEMIRYWDGDRAHEFENATQTGPDEDEYDTYATEAFRGDFTLGAILDERFGDTGRNYNVELHYEDGDGDPASRALVYQGSPTTEAVTASYTVVLYEEQPVTSSAGGTLATAESTPPIPSDSADRIYNVVEVRVIVW